jgi:two-component system chemotaxis response regulator CheB
VAGKPRKLVVVGASAGGVEALRDFVGGLPGDFRAAVLIVLHLPAGGASALPAILERSATLPVAGAQHGEPLRQGRIYTAPPDHHLVVEGETIRLSRGPTENGHRPAIDTLFRSAAQAQGPAVVGVVLSGSLDDGTAGLSMIKARGGLVAVQDPDEALYRGMPDSAIAHVSADFVLPAGKMGVVLAARMREAVDEAAWAAHASFGQQPKDIEEALWAALRALEEKRDLAGRMVRSSAENGNPLMADRYRWHRDETSRAIEVLRRYLLEGRVLPSESA